MPIPGFLSLAHSVASPSYPVTQAANQPLILKSRKMQIYQC